MKADEADDAGRKIMKNLEKNKKPRTIGWGPVSAVLVTLGVYFGSQIIAGYAILEYLFATGSKRADISSTIDNSIILQFIYILIAEAVTLALLFWFLRRRRISLSRIGVKRPSGKNLFFALPGYAIYFAIILLVFSLIQNLIPNINVDQGQQIGFDTANGPGPLFFVFIALAILPALVEEIMVRGFLYGGLKNKFPVMTSAILASAIFGAAHLQLGSGNSPVWIAAIDTFTLSLVLIWLREKTGNIWAGVVVHMIKNSLAFASLFLFKTL